MDKSSLQVEKNKNSSASTVYSHKRSKTLKLSKGINSNQIIVKAKLLYHSGKLNQALLLFEEAIGSFNSYNKIQKTVVAEVYYLSGTICMATNQYEKAEKYLKRVIKQTGNYKNSYLFLSISLQKIGKVEESLQILNELCDKLKSLDGFFYRGKLRLKNMDFEKAAEDFSKIVNKNNTFDSQAKLYLLESQFYSGKCMKNMEQKAYRLLNELSQMSYVQTKNLKKCRNLLSAILIKLQKYEEAQKFVDKNLKQLERDSQTLLMKSKICAYRCQTDQQVLLLSQCITVKDHKRSVTEAVQILVINAMKQKDFYEAFQYSKRKEYLQIQNKTTLNLLKMAEALIFLMKKKYGEAILIFGSIDPNTFSNLSENYHFAKNLYYNAFGYSYFSLGDHKEALKNYKKIEINIGDEDQQIHLFNASLCQGIISIKGGKVEQAIKWFQTSTKHLIRTQPYFYISVILIQKHVKVTCDPDLLFRVMPIIDLGIKISNYYKMYYYRSLLFLYLGFIAQAMEDIDKAIQKSEDNIAVFFYIRGLIFFLEKNYNNAIEQFTTCLSIDDMYHAAYLQRAKAKLLTQQSEQAYEDLQKYPMNQQWKPLFLLYEHSFDKLLGEDAGNLYFSQIANFYIGHFENGGFSGKIVNALLNENFKDVLNLLQKALEISYKIGCLHLDDIYLIKSYCHFKLGMYQQSLAMLGKSQQQLKSGECISSFGEEDENKLVAIKINTIFVYIKKFQITKALQLCQNFINEVYQGAVCDELIKLKKHLQNILQQQQMQTSIQLFMNTPMISDYFKQDYLSGINFRYLIPFPKVKVPQIEMVPYEQPLIDFTISNIDNRAEPPWIRKNQNGVIFTNKIQIFQNLQLCTEIEEHDQIRGKSQKEQMKEKLLKDADMLNKLQKLDKTTKPIKSSRSFT